MRFHTAVGCDDESVRRPVRERLGPVEGLLGNISRGERSVARQEADTSSHAFDVWSCRMMTARGQLAAAWINRCRRSPEDRRLRRRCEDGRSDATVAVPPAPAAGTGRSNHLGGYQRYVSMCSIPCLETLPRITLETSFSFIHPGLVFGAVSSHAHA